jgi:hypothetical protein
MRTTARVGPFEPGQPPVARDDETRSPPRVALMCAARARPSTPPPRPPPTQPPPLLSLTTIPSSPFGRSLFHLYVTPMTRELPKLLPTFFCPSLDSAGPDDRFQLPIARPKMPHSLANVGSIVNYCYRGIQRCYRSSPYTSSDNLPKLDRMAKNEPFI